MRAGAGGVGLVAVAVFATGLLSSASAAPSYRRVSGHAFRPSETKVSGNGRYVVFVASSHSYGPTAENLTGAKTIADATQVYVADLRSGAAPELISVSVRGTPGNFDSSHASISADGRYVVFASRADNLVGGDVNYSNNDGEMGWDVFLRDRTLRRTTRVSLDVNGRELADNSDYPTISADGSTIAYFSVGNVPAWQPPPHLGFSRLYVIPRGAPPAKVTLAGRFRDGRPMTWARDHVGFPALSANGRYLASYASESLDGSEEGEKDRVFVRDLRLRKNVYLPLTEFSVTSSDAALFTEQTSAGDVSMDASGTKVLFQQSVAVTLQFTRRLVWWNVRTGAVEAIEGRTGSALYESSISGDGRYAVVTRSEIGGVHGSSFTPTRDVARGVFVVDLARGGAWTEVAGCAQATVSCWSPWAPSISADGSVIAFVASAPLDPTDDPDAVDPAAPAAPDPYRANAQDDVYIWRR